MFYKIVLNIIRIFCAPFFYRKVVGAQNIPRSGGLIIALNHRSNWDVVMAALSCPRMLNFMAKKELFHNKLFGWLISHLGAFPLSRGTGDIKAVKTAIGRLKDGKVLQLFPEGTRVKGNEDVDAKAGVAMLAIRGQVPVVPGVIVGEYKPFCKLHVVFGKPVSLDSYYGQKPDTEQLQKISEKIMQHVRTMDAAVKQCISEKNQAGIAALVQE